MLLNIRIHFKIILWIIQIWCMSAEDIDECSKLGIPCRINEVCQNKNDTYSCQCKSGWEMDPDIHYCVDINECKINERNPCGEFLYCKNTPGSYICLCNIGFTMGGDNASCVRKLFFIQLLT
ncbi:fibulin-1-like [Hydra vulgaris]|uniref:Fibulin-1-like n=1 Tax=Hydra vulgaris TaxID=6087 RepID=A0ABM4C949_HYDVU